MRWSDRKTFSPGVSLHSVCLWEGEDVFVAVGVTQTGLGHVPIEDIEACRCGIDGQPALPPILLIPSVDPGAIRQHDKPSPS